MVTAESWERLDREKGHAQQCCVEEHEAKRGCKMKDFATIKTPHGQRMTYTGQNNRANFKHTKFTIIHIRWFCSFFTDLALYWNKSPFKKTRCCTKSISCPVNISHRI